MVGAILAANTASADGVNVTQLPHRALIVNVAYDPPTATPEPPVDLPAAPTPTVYGPDSKLNHDEAVAIFREQGFAPVRAEEAWRVVSGSPNCPNGESGAHPWSINPGGPSYGLFQLTAMWFTWAGYSLDQWPSPYVSARVAYLVTQYDVEHGWDDWAQWECQP